MPITLIHQFPKFSKKVEGDNKLKVAELFVDTIQGEGISTGIPASFLRLKDCSLQCVFCDTLEVWKQGNEYSFNELFSLLEEYGVVQKFRQGQRLVLTGGSPLLQQNELTRFIHEFYNKYHFKPYIEVENECMIEPTLSFIDIVNQWNNSPKLSNSGMKEKIRYKPELLRKMSLLPNSYFKFVVDCKEDWQEINEFFLLPELIKKEQIILMPCGQTQDELSKTRELVADLAVEKNVRFSDRLHVTIWNKKTGV